MAQRPWGQAPGQGGSSRPCGGLLLAWLRSRYIWKVEQTGFAAPCYLREGESGMAPALWLLEGGKREEVVCWDRVVLMDGANPLALALQVAPVSGLLMLLACL